MYPVEIKNLKVRFIGAENETLSIEKFRLEENSAAAITGRSGCGKTTLLNILSGVLRPSSGSVSVCGTDYSKLSEQELDRFRSENIGYIFQNLNLLQGYTAYENIEMGLALSGIPPRREKILEALDLIGLSSDHRKYPFELSLGQQQRVAVMRAVMKKPKLILADEPTSSLDEYNSSLILKLLKEKAAENSSALLVVSHELEIISSFETRIEFSSINSTSVSKQDLKGGGQ